MVFNDVASREAEKARELLSKYGVDELADPRDISSLREIAIELGGTSQVEFETVTRGKPEDSVKMKYLHVLIEQNFIIIRQLDRLNRNLEK